MSDLERFVALYESFGIPCVIEDDVEDVGRRSESVLRKVKCITLEAHSHTKLVGYSGFATTVVFDEDGNFVRQEIAE